MPCFLKDMSEGTHPRELTAFYLIIKIQNTIIMGWTSFHYNESTHMNWSEDQAKLFLQGEFENNGYKILVFHLQKAKTSHHRNVIYTVIEHPKGYNFLMVVLVDIKDNEIYFKEIPSDFGPSEDECPVSFLKLLPEPKNDYCKEWRVRVERNNLQI